MSKIKARQNLAQNTEQTNPQQLLQFLDNIVAMAPVTRQVHFQAQQAIQQLSVALKRLDTFMLAGEMDKEDLKEKQCRKPQKSE